MSNRPSAAFGTFKKSALSEEIVEKLLSLIQERELKPGDKLPPERELAVMMQVSRPSLREALRALSIMNVVEIRQGDGTYVTTLEPHLLMSHLDFIFALSDMTLLDLFAAREILETGIVALAAQRITDPELAQLEACLARARQHVDDYPRFMEIDIELHDLIARIARNSILERFMASLSQIGRASRRRTTELPGLTQQSLRDHQAIIQALKQRDPQAARAAMLRHLRHVEAALQKLHGPAADAAAGEERS